MHLQPVFKTEKSGIGIRVGKRGQKGQSQLNSQCVRYRARVVGGAVSEYLFERGLCLPSGTQMTEDDLGRIVRIIRDVHTGKVSWLQKRYG